MLETGIGIVSSVASVVLRIIDRKGKYTVLATSLNLIGAVAFLIAAIKKKKEEEELCVEE